MLYSWDLLVYNYWRPTNYDVDIKLHLKLILDSTPRALGHVQLDVLCIYYYYAHNTVTTFAAMYIHIMYMCAYTL